MRYPYAKRDGSRGVPRAALNVRSLKAQRKAREKSMKLRAYVVKQRFKLAKLERKTEKLRTKIREADELAARLEQDIVPPKR